VTVFQLALGLPRKVHHSREPQPVLTTTGPHKLRLVYTSANAQLKHSERITLLIRTPATQPKSKALRPGKHARVSSTCCLSTIKTHRDRSCAKKSEPICQVYSSKHLFEKHLFYTEYSANHLIHNQILGINCRQTSFGYNYIISEFQHLDRFFKNYRISVRIEK